MPSLFAGTDELICSALGITGREQLNARAPRINPLSGEEALSLVGSLYNRMAGNVPPRIEPRSGILWQCRHATEIQNHNPSRETILEKTVTVLAKHGHMPGWFNQCPVASGIAGPYSDRRRAVDLVHISRDTARLIELKWASNTPAYALFQLLEYGLAYVFARLHMQELGLEDRELMHVRHVALEVVGPRAFFRAAGWTDLLLALGKALAQFATEQSGRAWSVSLEAQVFPEEFGNIPILDGREVNATCRAGGLTNEGRMVRDAFQRLMPAPATLPDRFLTGVPGSDVERVLNSAPGDEIRSGKFNSPESSSALAANAFGFFLHRAEALPPLPGCKGAVWPARSVSIETTVRFPWRGGRHPVLDSLVVTPTALVGIESKRFEPFRGAESAAFSEAFWRPVWGDRMTGYERVRDILRENPAHFAFLHAAQLVKHAFALRSEVQRPGAHHGLKPILFYVYAEPECWPRSGRPIEDVARAAHSDEIARFARLVGRDEVSFVPCSYRNLLGTWRSAPGVETARHAEAVLKRFSP